MEESNDLIELSMDKLVSSLMEQSREKAQEIRISRGSSTFQGSFQKENIVCPERMSSLAMMRSPKSTNCMTRSRRNSWKNQ
jgi:hypothetical protein